ncbi:MAG: hypothetical protein QNJ98_12575 [Planctomycetota bacterium]|nr:hypothetical protein [Planctomycetota bacterium]
MNRAVFMTIAVTALLVVGGVVICWSQGASDASPPAKPAPERAPELEPSEPDAMNEAIASVRPS